MIKKSIFCILVLFSRQTKPFLDNHPKAKKAVIAAAATGTTYVFMKAWAHNVVKHAQTEFALLRNVLNNYAHYAHNWTSDIEQSLIQDLTAHIVHLHNTHRDRWKLFVLFDIYAGNPTLYVQNKYRSYPLLQIVDDLNHYIGRLKFIYFCRLYADRTQLNNLIEQLVYLQGMLLSSHNYSTEEQNFAKNR